MSAGQRKLSKWAMHAILIVLSIVTLVPYGWLLIASLKNQDDFFSAIFLPPGDGVFGIGWDKLTLDNYQNLFGLGFGVNLVNSIFYSATTALAATLICAATGYVLAKHQFRGRNLITVVVLGALIVPPTLLLAPGYELLYDLGLLDTAWGLLLPLLAPAFGVFLFRQAVIQSVPDELLEAARIDGASEWSIFFIVVFPLVRPMIGAFMLITFLGMWNNFISPQIVLQTADKQPLSVAISQLRGVYKTDYGLLTAATVVSVLPVAALFLLLQKQFISGLTSGAVKG
ncbi:MAG: carbohydrate ABC transporter permease [Phycisphaerales bacterium]|nr:carbohydrate ABC transporter permease [Phycisphaerales bacterium]